MRLLLFFGIILVLSSCNKETFTPCAGFEQLCGEWKSIDADALAHATFYENGKFQYASGVDRTYSEKIKQCANKYGNGWDYFLLEFEDGILAVFHNANIDTIVFNASAYNHTASGEIEYKRYFVRSY